MIETEVELLKLAAKAVGLECDFSEVNPSWSGLKEPDLWIEPGWWYVDDYDCWVRYDPYSCTYELLELMKKLEMNVNFRHKVVSALSPAGQLIVRSWGEKKDCVDMEHAVVEIAAYIGKYHYEQN